MIQSCELPVGALLRTYRDSQAYTDCFMLDFPRAVTQAEYVAAFYTTWVFKLERLILAWTAARPSTDEQARELALGRTDVFAAWSVEDRTSDQLLMCDFQKRTRSWLMTAAGPDGSGTRLYFGSAVVPVRNARSGRDEMGLVFRALLGFHQVYSRLLLHAAASRLRRRKPGY